MTYRDVTDPSDRFPEPFDHEGVSLQERELAGMYDAEDGYAHLDAEPGPLTRHADPLAPGPFG